MSFVRQFDSDINPMLLDVSKYIRIQDQIRKLIAQRDKLISQRKTTPILQIKKRQELSGQIDSLTQQIEGCRKAKENLLKARRYPSEKEMQEVGKRLYAGEEKVTKLEKEESTYSLALQRRQEDYNRWMQNAQNVDGVSLSKARTANRSENINRLTGKHKAQYGADFQKYILQGAIHDTDRWCVDRQTSVCSRDGWKSSCEKLERKTNPRIRESVPTKHDYRER